MQDNETIFFFIVAPLTVLNRDLAPYCARFGENVLFSGLYCSCVLLRHQKRRSQLHVFAMSGFSLIYIETVWYSAARNKEHTFSALQ